MRRSSAPKSKREEKAGKGKQMKSPSAGKVGVVFLLVVRFISNWSFNAGSVVLNDWPESDHSHSYGSFPARMFSAAMAS